MLYYLRDQIKKSARKTEGNSKGEKESKRRDRSTSLESRRMDIIWPIHVICLYFIPEYCMCKGSFYIRGLYAAKVLGAKGPYALKMFLTRGDLY